MGFIPGMHSWFRFLKSSVIHCIYREQGENHMIILVNGKKVFDRLQHSYIAKIFSKQGKFFDLIKNAYKKYMTKLIFPPDI